MNEPNYQSSDYPNPDYQSRSVPADLGAQFDDCVRRNPGLCVLVALIAGVIAGVFARSLKPEPTPQSRWAQMLKELQECVHDNGAPVLRKASSLASEGAHALGSGVHRSEEHFEKVLRKAARRLRKFWP